MFVSCLINLLLLFFIEKNITIQIEHKSDFIYTKSTLNTRKVSTSMFQINFKIIVKSFKVTVLFITTYLFYPELIKIYKSKNRP